MDLNLDPVRRLNESLMKDIVRITSQEDESSATWNPTTGEYDYAPVDVVYNGVCQIWSSKEGSYPVTEGSSENMLSRVYIEIPMDAPEPPLESVATILFVNPQGNQQMVDQELLVRGLDHYSYSVGQILRCEARKSSP